jgi:hypothetical protein
MTELSNDEAGKRSAEFKEMMGKAAGESNRGFVITAAAVLDFYLERVIKAFLIDSPQSRELFEGAYAPFGDLSGKIKAAYLMGLITKEEADRVTAIRKVRNIFAHEIDASFDHPRVTALCERPPIHAGKNKNREAFIEIAVEVGIGFIHRDTEIAKDHKRKPRKEPKPVSPDPSRRADYCGGSKSLAFAFGGVAIRDGSGKAGCSVPAFRCTNRTAGSASERLAVQEASCVWLCSSRSNLAWCCCCQCRARRASALLMRPSTSQPFLRSIRAPFSSSGLPGTHTAALPKEITEQHL